MLNFFKSGIWTLRAADFPPFVRSLIALLRIIVLSVRCFFKNNCMLHASALTYYTLLAIVPVAALAFAIAKGFGLYARLETWFRGTLVGKEEVAEKIITFQQPAGEYKRRAYRRNRRNRSALYHNPPDDADRKVAQ